ncbi:MAG TPA: squalene synthase HpnC [Acidimicrobiales bacterium]|nr:squalene synthase HpnC [Acidimicrobiales bacterium]
MSAQIDAQVRLRERAREENFPVASRVLPRDLRATLLAVYGFARLVDDVGDEAAGDRLAQLDALEAELDAAVAGEATHPVLAALTPVLRTLDCGVAPFRALLEANRVDQRVASYETFDDLRGYCLLSAAPVGRIVLSAFGATTPARVARSDDVCVGLQLVEHLQDVGEDAHRGRVYLPRETLEAEGCDLGALRAASASPALRRAVLREARRADRLLGRGIPLAASMPFRPRLAIAGFVAGGQAALDSVRRAGGDVLSHACRPTRRGLARRAFAAALAARGTAR